MKTNNEARAGVGASRHCPRSAAVPGCSNVKRPGAARIFRAFCHDHIAAPGTGALRIGGSVQMRAGVISSLVLAIGYLYVTPFSSQFHVWAFMILVAVCFVLMMKSLVDLFAWAFNLAAAFSGRGLGKFVRFVRGL